MLFHVLVNANSIVQHVIQIKNGMKKHVSVNANILVSAKKIKVRILADVFLSIIDTSVIARDEIICYGYCINKNDTYYSNKKVRYKIDCYILKTVLLVIILQLIITIICYHYAKPKGIDALLI